MKIIDKKFFTFNKSVYIYITIKNKHYFKNINNITTMSTLKEIILAAQIGTLYQIAGLNGLNVPKNATLETIRKVCLEALQNGKIY